MEVIIRCLEGIYGIPIAIMAVIAAIILFIMKKVRHLAIGLLILAIVFFIISR